jgi:hypothetical protein
MADRVTPSASHRWLRWLTIGSAIVSSLLLIVIVLTAVLWILVPWRVASLICEYSPWLTPAYHACQQADMVSLLINERFAANHRDKSVMMSLVVEKLSDDDAGVQKFAASFANGVLWGEQNTGKKVTFDPEVRAQVIARTVKMLSSTDHEAQQTALSLLCLLQAKEHLPQMIVICEAIPAASRGFANRVLGLIDDPQATSWLLAEFERCVSIDLLNSLSGQSDPRALAAIHSVLHVPGHPNHTLILYVLLRWPPTDAAGLAEVAKLCSHPLKSVRESALNVLGNSAAGFPHLLNLRRDPDQSTLHAPIDEIITRSAYLLTPDEKHLWQEVQTAQPTVPASP